MTVQVHGFEDRLEVFHGQEQIAVLPRLRGTGRRHIQAEHYGRSNGPASKGDPLQQRFEAIGPVAADYLRGLARARGGHLREQAESILSLCDEHGAGDVHEAMVRAASFGAYSYKTIKGILTREGRALPEAPSEERPAPLVDGSYPEVAVEERSPAYYAAGGEG